MTNLTELIARVEACEGADREIDGDLWWRFCPQDAGRVFNNAATGLPRPLDHERPMPEGLGHLAVRTASPAYTASLDQAVKFGALFDVAPAYVLWPALVGGDPHAPADQIARRGLVALLKALQTREAQP